MAIGQIIKIPKPARLSDDSVVNLTVVGAAILMIVAATLAPMPASAQRMTNCAPYTNYCRFRVVPPRDSMPYYRPMRRWRWY